MMPVYSGGGLTARVHVDANAVIDYVRECALHSAGRAPTGRKAEKLRMRLDQMPRVFVAKTAGIEAQRNLPKDLVQKLGRSEARKLAGRALKILLQYRKAAERNDRLDHVTAVKKMYADICNNPHGQKFSTWARKKSLFVDNPVLGSDANDLRILSTAAYYARRHAVEFWTHDMDFTIFGDEIRNTFGLKVVDTYRLWGFLAISSQVLPCPARSQGNTLRGSTGVNFEHACLQAPRGRQVRPSHDRGSPCPQLRPVTTTCGRAWAGPSQVLVIPPPAPP